MLEHAGRAASARGLDRPALTNIMPRYLEALRDDRDSTPLMERHFATRLRQGFDLAEIVDEFALLGRCIVERTVGAPAKDRLDVEEIDRLYPTLARASASVIAMFDEHMRQDEQLEKRYSRRLRDVAAAALRAETPALKSELVEAHGGVVSVASDATTGTTFTIELPYDARPFAAGTVAPSHASVS